MPKRRIGTLILALLVTLTLVFANVAVVFADEGGKPNEKAAKGAEHANENSAHYKNTEPSGPWCDGNQPPGIYCAYDNPDLCPGWCDEDDVGGWICGCWYATP